MTDQPKHNGGWGDGTSPRLCKPCRLARGCRCYGCESERQGAAYPTTRRE